MDAYSNRHRCLLLDAYSNWHRDLDAYSNRHRFQELDSAIFELMLHYFVLRTSVLRKPIGKIVNFRGHSIVLCGELIELLIMHNILSSFRVFAQCNIEPL